MYIRFVSVYKYIDFILVLVIYCAIITKLQSVHLVKKYQRLIIRRGSTQY